MGSSNLFLSLILSSCLLLLAPVASDLTHACPLPSLVSFMQATEENYMQLIVWVAGIVQTALYLDFFYNYINAKQKGIDAPIELPA